METAENGETTNDNKRQDDVIWTNQGLIALHEESEEGNSWHGDERQRNRCSTSGILVAAIATIGFWISPFSSWVCDGTRANIFPFDNASIKAVEVVAVELFCGLKVEPTTNVLDGRELGTTRRFSDVSKPEL